MRTDGCQRYLDDPEANASHLDECEECRALFAPPDESLEAVSITLDALPLASWEGATYRAWPLVAGAALAVLAMACALFVVAGVSPLRGIRATLSSVVPPLELLRAVPQLIGNAAQHAPYGWQIAVGVSFLVVNTVLILLLRRAPKGIDV